MKNSWKIHHIITPCIKMMKVILVLDTSSSLTAMQGVTNGKTSISSAAISWVFLGFFSQSATKHIIHNDMKHKGTVDVIDITLISTMTLHDNWEINSLRPSDALWRHRSMATLAQVMACCLTAPSHYLNQCWLIISKVLWHSREYNFTGDTSAINHKN